MRDAKSDLARQVYKTYKSRICAAERLKATDSFIRGLNIYYSLVLTTLTIYALIDETSQHLSVILIILSVMLTVSITFLSSKRYGERAKDLKNHYILLGQLEQEIQASNDDKDLCKFREKYTVLLNSSENHTEYDYYSAMSNMKDKKEWIDLSPSQKILDYYVYRIVYFILKVLAIVVPFLIRYLTCIIEWVI